MSTRSISASTLRAWGVRRYSDESAAIVRQHLVGMDRFECVGSIVFQAPDDGKLYHLIYEYNDESGWCPLDEEDGTFECREVTAAEKVVTAYYFADGKEAE